MDKGDPDNRWEHTLSQVGAASTVPAAAPARPTTAAGDPLPTLGNAHYRLGPEHARGGIGRVLLAHDRRLDRSVAIKELLDGDVAVELRFLREARLTARLQHPSIVPVYEAGYWPSGKPFYAMKFVSGRTLKELILERPRLGERLALLPHVIAVAQAVGYAHNQGIVHRDIKPSNVIVGPFGETMVVDWGLAKDLRDDTAAAGAGPYRTGDVETTACGAILGTPAYMPPEQARGESVDERADVYAIGALLYHAIVGEPPHAESDSREALARAARGHFRSLANVAPRAPRELCAIVDKAMQPDRNARYATGAELAHDLERFAAGQLVSAHPYSRLFLLARWTARHKLPVGLSALFLALLLALGSVSVVQVVRQKNRAETREQEMILASALSYLDRDPTMTLAWLKRYPPTAAGWPAARTLALEAVGAGVAAHVLRPRTEFVIGALSPDGRRFALPGSGRSVQVRDLESGRIERDQPYEGRPLVMQWSADGRRIVWCDETGGGLTVWDWQTDAPHQLHVTSGLNYAVDVSPDSRFAATGSRDGSITLVELATGRPRRLGRSARPVTSAAFAPGGGTLAVSTGDALELWPLAGGPAARLAGDATLDGVEWSADGNRLLAVGDNGVVYVWDRAAGRRFALRHPGQVVSARLSADGRRVLSGGNDKIVRLWDVDSGAAQKLEGHTGAIASVLFGPSAGQVISAGQDRVIRIWDLASGDSRLLRGHGSAIQRLRLSSDRRRLVSVSLDGSTRIWELPRDQEAVFAGATPSVLGLGFVDQGHVVTTGTGGPSRLRDLGDGTARDLGGPATSLVHSADGALLAVAQLDGAIQVWRGDGSGRTLNGPAISKWSLALACDGRMLASGDDDGAVRLWDLDGGPPRTLAAHRGTVSTVAYSPDCRLLASAGEDGQIRLWNPETGQSRALSGHAQLVSGLAFSPDGTKLASASWDGTLRLWDLSSGRAQIWRGHSHRVRVLRFSPDGRTVASAGDGGVIQLWDVASGRSRALVGHRDAVRALVFSRDGRLLASASSDFTARLWDVAAAAPLQVFWHQDIVRALDLSPDGARLAAGGYDTRLRIWRVAPPPLIGDGGALSAWLATQTSATVDAEQRPFTP